MYIFLDLDDTLIDSNGAHKKAIWSIYADFFVIKKKQEDIESIWLKIMEKYLNLYFKGEITLLRQRMSRIQEFWNYLGKNIDEYTAMQIYNQYHKMFLSSCSLFEDVIPFLNQISHLQIGILSNGCYSDQIFKLENNKIDSYFNQICISEKVGYSKPDKKIFEHAASQVNKDISECIYIGNSYKLDYLGGLNAGMKAIWLDRINSDNNHKINRVISLKHIPDKIKSINV